MHSITLLLDIFMIFGIHICQVKTMCHMQEYLPPSPFENVVLRNEFNFWNVHGIMNSSGLVQSK